VEDAFLEVRRKNSLERVELKSPQVTLGRASENSIRFIEDEAVSRRHAVLTRVSDGWSLRDTGSANGTYVNGERLAAERVLKIGDRVTLGSSEFVLRGTANPTAPPMDRAPSPAPVIDREPVLPDARGRDHAAAEFTGVVRAVQKRRGPNNRDDLVFHVDRFDRAGNRLPAVPVHLEDYRGGDVREGEEVEIEGTWVGDTLRAKTVVSFNTGSEITSGPRWEYRALAGLTILLLLLLLIIAWMALGL